MACLLGFLVLLLVSGPPAAFAESKGGSEGKNGEANADLVITHIKVYSSPESEPIPDATVWIRDGKIERVSSEPPAKLDPELKHIDGQGRVLTAAFWNSHVHFTPPVWQDPSNLSDAEIVGRLRTMLTGFGFASVVDTGSDPRWVEHVHNRIATGAPGPRILMAGGSFVGENASPAYLDFKLPELATIEQAKAATEEILKQQPAGIKIFTGSFAGPGKALHMELPVVQAVTSTAHAAGAWVIAHPQSLRGVELAAEGGVDILAHTAPDAGRWPKSLIEDLIEKGMALIPTLQLWRFELSRAGAPPTVVDRFQQAGVDQLGDFIAAGGEVLFGTDVGYMTILDPSEEYQKMSEAGMSYRQILASLTTAPARRFGQGSGTVAPGEAADLVILAGDPAVDAAAFAKVEMTLRDGRVIFEAQEDPK